MAAHEIRIDQSRTLADVTVDGIAAVPNTVVSAILPDDIFV